MNRNKFNRAVVEPTGESVATIAYRGFILLTPVPFERESYQADYDDLLEGDSASAQARSHITT